MTEPVEEQVTEAPPPKDIPEVAREVIAGLWGRGNNRKERLQAAGYDVAAVSEEMSKILKGQ
jgi:lysozyme